MGKTEEEVILSEGLGHVDDMKYDWTTNNLYYYDRHFSVVEALHISQNSSEIPKRFIIFPIMTYPLRLALDPIHGYMYINQKDFNRRNIISRFTMDGKNKEILRNDTNDRSKFSLAYSENRLFFCGNNGTSILMLNLTSNVTTAIVQERTEFCDEIDIRNNELFAYNSTDRTIRKIDLNTKENNILKKFPDSKLTSELRLIVNDKSKQKGNSSCSTVTESCQEACVPLSQTETKCICSFGRANGTKCIEPDSYLAYGSEGHIKIAFPQSSDHSSQYATHKDITDKNFMKKVVGLTADIKNERFFYTDSILAAVYSINFNGSNAKRIKSSKGYYDGIAFDELNNFLYFTSNSKSRIFGCDLERDRNCTTILRFGRGDHPRAIVIDPCVRKLFWTNLRRDAPSIQSSSLIGWNRKTIISTRIIVPNGLAIDPAAQKLYWADATLNKIERCDYDGLHRLIILSKKIDHTFGLDIMGDFLYWTDVQSKTVMRANKYSGGNVAVIKQHMTDSPLGIVAISKKIPSCKDHLCSKHNGGCEQNCETLADGKVQCSCFPNYHLNPDSKTCSYADDFHLNCDRDSQFSCSKDRKCIPIEATCDGENHCSDNSDEKEDYCYNRHCPPSYFRCNNTQCVKSSTICDGRRNCKDGSDEIFCSTFKASGCNDDQFLCGVGNKCIPKKHVCDRDRDCEDASDERDCQHLIGCKKLYDGTKEMIRCNGTTACILPEWICDGVNDCWDNEDELSCSDEVKRKICPKNWLPCDPNSGVCYMKHWANDSQRDCPNSEDEIGSECPEETFKCNITHCILKDFQCDGTHDCSDGADENNCHNVCKEPNYFKCNKSSRIKCIPYDLVCDGENHCDNGEDEFPLRNCSQIKFNCSADEFNCRNGMCIPKRYHCDGIRDCSNNLDEIFQCVPCKKDEVRCPSSAHKCVPKCNDIEECNDGYDELSCHKKSDSLSPEQYRCDNGEIINAEQLCDDKNNCRDHSDENNCEVDLCKTLKPCDHICTNKYYNKDKVLKGYECSCRNGYKLNGTTCELQDLCAMHQCSQKCQNIWNETNTYRCSCVKGYHLSSDHQTCITNSNYTKKIVVAYKYDIRFYSLNGSVLSGPTKLKLNNAVALDFHWATQTIFISDVSSESSKIVKFFINNGSFEILHTEVKNPDGIAVDWMGQNLYWADKESKRIEVSDLHGRYKKVLLENLGKPRAIVLHPIRGFLFYSDWGKHEIVRVGMDGQHVKRIVTEEIEWPNGLTIDYQLQKLYWADARKDLIGVCNLDGSGRRSIIQKNLPHIFAITFFEGFLYWSDWEMFQVQKARASNGKSRSKFASFIHKPMDLHVFHPERQLSVPNDKNPCVRDKCARGALCLIKPGGVDRHCMCPEKHYLSPDKSVCLSNCSSSEFTCTNTFKCIPSWYKCDGEDDCGDNSDEIGPCSHYHCPKTGLFQCASANKSSDCFSPTAICDGDAHCKDGSDELNCHNYTCLNSYFKCKNPPKCIPKSKYCNGKFDCDDHSDEKNCPIKSCEENHFQCDDKTCIL